MYKLYQFYLSIADVWFVIPAKAGIQLFLFGIMRNSFRQFLIGIIIKSMERTATTPASSSIKSNPRPISLFYPSTGTRI